MKKTDTGKVLDFQPKEEPTQERQEIIKEQISKLTMSLTEKYAEEDRILMHILRASELCWNDGFQAASVELTSLVLARIYYLMDEELKRKEQLQ